jgi:hypothetical protein
MCDILYTVEKDAFQEMINRVLVQRKQKIEQSQNIIVEIKPEFAQALQNTLNFSSNILITNIFYSSQRKVCLPLEELPS